MVIQAACPDPDVIRDLLNGNLPEAEQSELSSHFDLCPSCQQQFDAEASGPQFLGDVARLCCDTDWPHNTPTLDRLIRDMPQQLSDAADEASVATWSTEAVSDFLDTSENADHLGRLGSYEIVEVIGRGGMGIVLRGIDSRLNRVVAIKVMAPELASNPNARRRFYREGQAAAAVSHDNVVTIHAVDDHERLPYLVMEFVAGESLEECIRRAGSLPVESILRMGRQAALGLAAAHEVGLVHRDMKPANILLENGIQRVRITDFGLARATDDVSMTQTGTVTGTPLYMSPEQAGGEKIDHRSDLFSLGSVLYTMCTGRPAFRAQTTLGVIKRVCEDSPRPIREVNPDIPQWLVDIIDRLMAKQPGDRIQDAAELAELLGNHLAHLQDPDNVPAPAGVEATSSSRLRTLKPLLLAVLLIGAVGLGITEAAGVTDVREFLGIVLRLKTPEGTLVIEIEDPDVEVSIDGSEVVLAGITKKELRLKPGNYQYRATRNGEPAESEWVTIERDGKTVVRIQRLPADTVTGETPILPPTVNTDEPFARHLWVTMTLFDQKDHLELAALCCSEILRLYPDSEYGDRANEKLDQLAKLGQPAPNSPQEEPSSRFWNLVLSNEKQGRLDVALVLCHHIMMTYLDSPVHAKAEQKYQELEDTKKGAEGLAELFLMHSFAFKAEGNKKLADKMQQNILRDFPDTFIAESIRRRSASASPDVPDGPPHRMRKNRAEQKLPEEPYAAKSDSGEATSRSTTDGISLLSPARIRRFVPDEIVPVWFGKWQFKNIPEQLYGQNFAFTSLDGGLLEFDVSKVSGRNLNQRIWLLIPHQDWDGSRTTSIPEDHDPSLKFATRESMIAFGWSAWNDITSEHVAAHPNQPTTEMKWSVFYRDAKPGEKYRVRTHWKHTPMLVWGSTQLDGVRVEPQWDQRVAVFEPGSTIPFGIGAHVFTWHPFEWEWAAPEFLIGRLYTKRNGYQGVTRFRVDRDQQVTIAMYEWGHEHEGNPSGNWMPELTSRRDLAQMGWKQAGEMKARHTNSELPAATWFIYTRACKAGESFVLRNHKYQAPIVFSERKHRDTGPVDVKLSSLDQHAHRQREERLAKLVEEFNSLFKQKRYAESATLAQQAMREFPMNPAVELMVDRAQFALKTGKLPTDNPADVPPEQLGANAQPPKNKAYAGSIQLDASKVKTQIADRVGKPGVYGTIGSAGRNTEQAIQFFRQKADELKDGYRKPVRLDGYSMLVGQIPVTTQPSDRFELEDFDRTGNQLRIVFRQHTTKSVLGSNAETMLRQEISQYKELLKELPPRPDHRILLLERAKGELHLADLMPSGIAQDALRKKVRSDIGHARQAFKENIKKDQSSLSEYSTFIDPEKEPSQHRKRNSLRIGLLTDELNLTRCTRQEARTYVPGSEENQKLLKQAASEFETIHQKHRTQLGGLYARLWQAKCLQEIGEFKAARDILELLTSYPDSASQIKTLQTRATQFLLITLVDGNLEKPTVAISLATKWLESADKQQRRSHAGLYIRWELARAMYAAALEDRHDQAFPAASPAITTMALARRLRKMTHALIQSPDISHGPFQSHAEKLQRDLVELYPDEVAGSLEPNRSLFFATPLPTLPPGVYEATAEVRTVQDQQPADTDELNDKASSSFTIPNFEETIATAGTLTVPDADVDAAELKRSAVLAIVTKLVEDEAAGLQTSSPADVDISELISRSGQLEDVAKIGLDAKKSELYLDELRRAGKKWAMCAHLDHENVDVKIHAAKALAKLADPDTVAVLAVAAKRNAYGVMGSENATLHSIYQAELKRALEAATRLKLTPSGLTLTYEHREETPPRTVVHRSELNPEMFRSETDFARISQWLRNVYLADSEISAVPAPEPEGAIPTAKTIYTGLVGRLSIRTLISNGPGKPSTIKHVDPGYIFQYPQGQFFHRDVLPLDQIDDRHFVVNLTGQLDVPRDMVVKIWHAGGGVSHDECGLYVDGTLLGVVGDDRDKHNIYEVPLLKGRHNVRWELSGGTFRTNILLFQNPETESFLPIINAGPESVRKASADRVVLIESSRTDWPVSAKPDWLPEFVAVPGAD
jgi:hypothetical protein